VRFFKTKEGLLRYGALKKLDEFAFPSVCEGIYWDASISAEEVENSFNWKMILAPTYSVYALGKVYKFCSN
jgi:hypothetical protein